MAHTIPNTNAEIDEAIEKGLVSISTNGALIFTDVEANNWTADGTYTDYAYKCIIPLTGVTENHFITVALSPEDAVSGNIAPVVESGNGTMTMWGKEDTPLTIPSIMAVVQI